jgi:hypothetical protein
MQTICNINHCGNISIANTIAYGLNNFKIVFLKSYFLKRIPSWIDRKFEMVFLTKPWKLKLENSFYRNSFIKLKTLEAK